MFNLANRVTWQFMQRVLLTLIPLSIVLALSFWLLYRSEVNAVMGITRAEEQHTIQLASQIINNDLGT